ncbi:MAG: hypothetical protein C5B55_06045 [Blastocatellia bacterium]|nr:MAG: hypothetical protein C5B55_06045 [Blastocatellia bacterium]
MLPREAPVIKVTIMSSNFNRWVQALLVLCFLAFAASSQTKPTQTEEQDVIRVDTSLVQTDVMVFDKKGKFVDGLRPEQFQLKIDNQKQEISFFERVSANGRKERVTTDGTTSEVSPTTPSAPTATQGRVVIFYVDDLHLAPDSLSRTRKALIEFIDHGMGDKDQIAITSPSGQIGFLQQFSADKDALHAAVARLNYRANTKTDMESPPMSEYIALKIREGDEQALSYYIAQIQKQNCFPEHPGEPPICTVSKESARQLVKVRANEIVTESAPATDNTLRLLEGLMRSAAQLPGRKLAFVISDGFYLNDVKTGAIDRIKKVTDAAGRAGVVIYTIDARGIVSEALDLTNNRPIDSRGQLTASTIGEISSSQDGLNALAKDTGGRAFRNTNRPMSEWVAEVMDETANYYLLAWRPETDEQKRGKFKRIEITLIDRPDLTVRLRNAYFKSATLPLLTIKKKTEKDPTKAREDDMRLVIDAPVSQRQIPTEVHLHFDQVPGVGTSVTATVTLSSDVLLFELNDGEKVADVEIGGIFYDDKGKPLNSFVGRLKIYPLPSNSKTDREHRSVYSFRAWLSGGLYQVRVGVRDLKSGQIGSANEWITVPKI